MLPGLPNWSGVSSAGDPIVLGECLLRFIKRQPRIARMDEESEQSCWFLGQSHRASAGVLAETLLGIVPSPRPRRARWCPVKWCKKVIVGVEFSGSVHFIWAEAFLGAGAFLWSAAWGCP